MKLAIHSTYIHTEKEASLFSKFINWCDGQEKYRFGWLAAAVAGHGCIITPLVVAAVLFSGNNFILWIAAMLAMAISLITNLAALPTKITIPAFFFSIVIDIVIVAICVAQGFNLASIYVS